MYLNLMKDGEGCVWGGLSLDGKAQWFSPELNQWSSYKDIPGPRVPYDPWRRALVAYSRGKLVRDWVETATEIRSWLNVFEEYIVNNVYSD